MDALRKAAQALVDRWDTPLWKDAPHTGQYIDALRAALAQPEPAGAEDMEVYAAIANGYNKRTILEDFIVSLAHEVVKTPNASMNDILESIGYVHKTKLPKPEPDNYGDFNQLQKEIADTPEYKEAQEWAKQALKQPEPIPGATPMSEYAAKSAAVPGRAEALKQAGYTRRPRQLPKEDEQEPVGWFESPHGAFRANPLYKLEFPSQLLAWSVPLYTATTQRKPRKPLTDEEIGSIGLTLLQSGNVLTHPFARAIERAHRIGGES